MLRAVGIGYQIHTGYVRAATDADFADRITDEELRRLEHWHKAAQRDFALYDWLETQGRLPPPGRVPGAQAERDFARAMKGAGQMMLCTRER